MPLPTAQDGLTEARNDVPSCAGGLENLDEEHDYVIDEIDGELPRDLTGTFLRNGPGRQRIGDQAYGHWFDGDGMLSQFRFDGEAVRFRNRYVRTPKYIDETRDQAIRYRGFGTQIPGGLLKNIGKMPANPANTNSVIHAGRLFALNEGGKPWELNPEDLSTVGECAFDGGLHAGDVFSAHGKHHPRSGDYINFGAGMSGMSWRGPVPCLHIYRINPAGNLYKRADVALESFPFCHDFVITDRYAVFFINSIVFGNMLSVVAGFSTISDGVRFDEARPMQVVVVDLETLDVARRFDMPPGAIIHFGNAYERGDEIVVDGMYTDNFEANDTLTDVFRSDARFGGGRYHRYVLNMASGDAQVEEISDIEMEFPTFDTRLTGEQAPVHFAACSAYNGANSFFNGIVRVEPDGEVNQHVLAAGQYASEPLYAPSSSSTNSDDGYLLEVVYDGYKHRSELQIFRASDISGPMCRLGLKHHLPHQFHGFFQPA